MTTVDAHVAGPATRPGFAVPDGWVRVLTIATGVAVVAELVLLRLFSRTAIHVPAFEALSGAYRIGSVSGRTAFYAAVVLTAALAVTLALVLARSDLRRLRVTAAALGGFVAVAAMARVGLLDAATTTVVTAGLVLLLGWQVTVAVRGRAWPVALFTAAFAVAAVHALTQDLAGTGRGPGEATWALPVAEALALGAGGLAPLLTRSRPDRRVMIVAVVVGVLVTGGLAASAAAVKVLALWNFGLAGYFPGIFYGVALAGATLAVGTAWRAGHVAVAGGLLLVTIGAVGLHSTYQSGLVIVGLALLLAGAESEGVRGPSPAPETSVAASNGEVAAGGGQR